MTVEFPEEILGFLGEAEIYALVRGPDLRILSNATDEGMALLLYGAIARLREMRPEFAHIFNGLNKGEAGQARN